MITERNIERLDRLVAKYAYEDFRQANPLGKRRIRKDGTVKHNPYSLSAKTNEAREMLIMARKKDITKEEEEIVKAYLLKQKLLGEED